MTYSTDTYQPPANDTRVKVGHLVVGLVFLGVAGYWALRASGSVGGVRGDVVLPLLLVAAGLTGLLTMLVGGIRRRSAGGAVRLPDPVEEAGPSDHPIDQTTHQTTGQTTDRTTDRTTDHGPGSGSAEHGPDDTGSDDTKEIPR